MDERRVVEDVSNDDLGGADVPDIKFLSSGAIRDLADHVSAWNNVECGWFAPIMTSTTDIKVTGACFMLYYSIHFLITTQWHQIVAMRP